MKKKTLTYSWLEKALVSMSLKTETMKQINNFV